MIWHKSLEYSEDMKKLVMALYNFLFRTGLQQNVYSYLNWNKSVWTQICGSRNIYVDTIV